MESTINNAYKILKDYDSSIIFWVERLRSWRSCTRDVALGRLHEESCMREPVWAHCFLRDACNGRRTHRHKRKLVYHMHEIVVFFIFCLFIKGRQLAKMDNNLRHSVLQGISPTLKYSSHPFLPSPPPLPKKKKNSKSLTHPLYEQYPQNFG